MTIFDLTGRTTLVTGAGSPTGIGFVTARMLAELGARLVITSTTDRIHERVEELQAFGAIVTGLPGDLTDPETATRVVEHSVTEFGGLDIVLQNAGMTLVSNPETDGGTVGEISNKQWRHTMSRNLDYCYYVAKTSLPVMTGARWGRMIFVASVTDQ